jgi:uncharacterized protein YndB with AHSA1/START domain/uncharacterized damage-inducible protein DinB
MPDSVTDAVVRKTLTVQASPARAFAVFTSGFDTWWPRSHHIGKAPMQAAFIEGRVGGRCYTTHTDGSECDWGRVLAWEPPHRLVVSWQIDGKWQFEPDLSKSSEVEVRFTSEPDGRTRVDLEHRHLARHGADAESIRTSVDSPNGWSSLLASFGGAAERDRLAEEAMKPVASTASAIVAPIAMIFAMNDDLLRRALDGLSNDQLWQAPSESTNGMLWIAGHMVQTRTGLLRLLGETVETGWGELFERGATVGERDRYPQQDEIERVAAEVAARLQTRLASLSEEFLAQPPTIRRLARATTMADQLAFFGLHDSYHVGQIAYVRKSLGYPPLVG